MLTDTVFEETRWQEVDFDALAERAALATLAHLELEPENFEIAVLACDDARIADLNADFRDKPTATNVLSWPSEERGAEVAGDTPEPPEPTFQGVPEELGDIAIAYETCRREAEDAGKPFENHVTHLVVHGVLHLLGYDHIRDLDATLMEGLETEILEKMGIPDPYNEEIGSETD